MLIFSVACLYFLLVCIQLDPTLENWRRELLVNAAKELDKVKMIRFNEREATLFSTDLGRTASHFYIKYNTVEVSHVSLLLFSFISVNSHFHR